MKPACYTTAVEEYSIIYSSTYTQIHISTEALRIKNLI